jgi:hypothetical protein
MADASFAWDNLKIVIFDGVHTRKGPTNWSLSGEHWSLSGEQQQDNELSLNRNAMIAAETRAILDLNHDFMLKQMAGSELDMTKLLAPSPRARRPRCRRPREWANWHPWPAEPHKVLDEAEIAGRAVSPLTRIGQSGTLKAA